MKALRLGSSKFLVKLQWKNIVLAYCPEFLRSGSGGGVFSAWENLALEGSKKCDLEMETRSWGMGWEGMRE